MKKPLPTSLLSTNNQFGPEYLRLLEEREFCVPSVVTNVVMP